MRLAITPREDGRPLALVDHTGTPASAMAAADKVAQDGVGVALVGAHEDSIRALAVGETHHISLGVVDGAKYDLTIHRH